LNHIKPMTSYEQARYVGLIIGMAVENKAAKKEAFKRLSEVVKVNVFFTINTSTVLISGIAKATSHPQT